MKKYALYLNSTERFIMVCDDLWIMMNTARILSSKMCLCVCQITDNDIDNNASLEWGLIDSSESKQTQQHPALSIIKKGTCYRGIPQDIESKKLNADKAFAEFAFKVVRSSMLVDALMNTVNQKFYLDLLEEKEITAVNDDSGVPEGFLKTIYKILYLSDSIDEIKEKLNTVLTNKNSDRPTNLSIYKKLFEKFLNDE